MALHETLLSSFSSVGSFFGSNYFIIGGSIIGGIVLIIVIWIALRNRTAEYGTYAERRALKNLGYSFIGLGVTGRGLLSSLRSGIKGSIKLAKLGAKAGAKGGKLAKDTARYASKLIRGEERNVEEQLHQSAAAAASLELAEVIGKLANSELNEHIAKERIEFQLRSLHSKLEQLSTIENIDDATREFVKATGFQITSALIELAHHEGYEINVRKKSFKEAYRLLKIIKVAETLSKRIESRAISNQKSLARYNSKEISDLYNYMKGRIKEEKKKIKSAKKALKGADKSTSAALVQQLYDMIQTANKITQNVNKLIEILNQLKSINYRMLGALRKIRKDIKNILYIIKDALSKEKELQHAEKKVDESANHIREAAKDAESNIKSIQKEYPEEVLIDLTRNTGSILDDISKISKKILDIDTNKLIPFMNSLSVAMAQAYKVEESSRIANSYYVKLMAANDKFYELVVNSDFKEDVKNIFTQEIQIEKMEEKIAAGEENAAQASKSLFIKTGHTIQNSIGAIEQHMQYLNNNITLTEQIKDYILNTLTKMMNIFSSHKIRVNSQFAQKAQEYQKKLQQARFQESIAKAAA